MTHRLLADATVAFHFLFIAFVVLGGLAVMRMPRVAWLHLPAVAWVVWLELTGAICPLTPLENALRQRAGEGGYASGFIDHYLMPLIYPPGLTPAMQNWIALVLVASNTLLYGWALLRSRRRS